MIIKDRKMNIEIDVLDEQCINKSCYTPQLIFKNQNLKYGCGRQILRGCPQIYLNHRENKK